MFRCCRLAVARNSRLKNCSSWCTLAGTSIHPLEHFDGDGSIQRSIMGAIDDAHPARADHVDHDVLPDLLYQRIRTFQTALGYLRWTRAEFQGGICSSVPMLPDSRRVLPGILQGTIVTQGSATIPNPFLPRREAHIQKCTPGPCPVTTSLFQEHASEPGTGPSNIEATV